MGVPKLQSLGWLAVWNCDVPPALPGGLEVPVAPTPEVGGVGEEDRLARATRVHHVRRQVYKLVVLHLHKNKSDNHYITNYGDVLVSSFKKEHGTL